MVLQREVAIFRDRKCLRVALLLYVPQGDHRDCPVIACCQVRRLQVRDKLLEGTPSDNVDGAAVCWSGSEAAENVLQAAEAASNELRNYREQAFLETCMARRISARSSTTPVRPRDAYQW